MAEVRFPSIANNQIGYLYDTMAFGRAGVDADLQKFDTYGDGMCQHSPGYPIQPSDFIDFCYSLAEHLTAHPDDLPKIGYKFHQPSNIARFEFAASLKHNPDAKKEHYYNLEERKVSTSPSKQFDRRYESMRDWMDGSFEAVVRLLAHDYYSPFDLFRLRYDLHDWWGTNRNYGEKPPAISLGWTDDYNEAQRFSHAFRTLRTAAQAIDALDHAKRGVENYRRHIHREEPAEQPVEAA